MRNLLGKLSWFTATTIVNALVGLIVIPSTIAVAGAEAWGSIAVGQSVGSIATILIALGWGYNGPSLVARASAPERRAIAVNSTVARGVVSPVILAVAVAAAYVLAPSIPLGAAIACASVCLGGLGMAWFFIGEGRPDRMFLVDGVPRWLGNVLGIGALFLTGDVFVFLWIQLAGAFISVIAGSVLSILSGERALQGSIGFAPAFRGLRGQLYAGITVVTASSYASLPTLVVAATAPASVPLYALGERLMRLALMTATPFLQWVQGWVPRHTESRPREARIRTAVRVALLLSPVLGLSVAVGGPWAGALLSGGELQLTFAIAGLFGVAIASSTLSRVIGMGALLALGADRPVAISAIIGAAIGAPLLLVLVPNLGALGAALALALSELAVVGFQAVTLRRLMGKQSE